MADDQGHGAGVSRRAAGGDELFAALRPRGGITVTVTPFAEKPEDADEEVGGKDARETGGDAAEGAAAGEAVQDAGPRDAGTASGQGAEGAGEAAGAEGADGEAAEAEMPDSRGHFSPREALGNDSPYVISPRALPVLLVLVVAFSLLVAIIMGLSGVGEPGGEPSADAVAAGGPGQAPGVGSDAPSDADGSDVSDGTSYADEVLAVYETRADAEGDQARAANLRCAATALNGAVIEPGGTLSFNDVVGAPTAALGHGSPAP